MTTTGSSVVTDFAGARLVDADVAPVQPVGRRHGDHRARAGRPAAPSHRRAAADGVGGARARVRGAQRVDPRHGPAPLAPLRRPDGAPDPHPGQLRLDRASTSAWTSSRRSAHAFRRMPTGGFGTDPRSIEPFAARVPVGARALHGHRRARTSRSSTGRSCGGSRRARARRGVPPLRRAHARRLGRARRRALGVRHPGGRGGRPPRRSSRRSRS